MAITIGAGQPTVLIRKNSYEKANLNRTELDARFNLTDQEFRVEGDLVVVGPLPSDELMSPMIDFLESKGLIYFDDFFELSGNWPEWLRMYAR